MISFGELRKKSVEWQTELSTVEKIYALIWLLKGIYDRPALSAALVLRDSSALNKVYFLNYPQVEALDFIRAESLDDSTLESELTHAAQDAAQVSGLAFRLHIFQSTEARIEFTGPLGRRSAAQPLLVLRFVTKPPRIEPAVRPLLYPFTDSCVATIRALTLEELAAERIVLYSGKLRARDLFELWFILTHGASQLDTVQTIALAQTIAAEKKIILRSELDLAYAPFLERGWENALKEIRAHPTFAFVQAELKSQIESLLESR